MDLANVILGSLKSKTVWAAVGTALLGALSPPVTAWIAANPSTASVVVGTLFTVLRGMTNKSLADKGAGV